MQVNRRNGEHIWGTDPPRAPHALTPSTNFGAIIFGRASKTCSIADGNYKLVTSSKDGPTTQDVLWCARRQWVSGLCDTSVQKPSCRVHSRCILLDSEKRPRGQEHLCPWV